MFDADTRPSFGAICRPLAWLVAIVAMVAVVPLGCSKEELKSAYDSAAAKTQELAAPVVEKIEEQLPESGNAVLQMTPAIEFNQAGVEVIPLGNQINVVQIMTYQPGKRDYPCMMLHGRTNASSVSTLTGEAVECDMYLHRSSSSPIAMTKPGSSVVVTFGPFDAEQNTLRASLGMVNLIGTDGKEVLVQGGDVLAVVSGGGN
jgi:hypothetical protein